MYFTGWIKILFLNLGVSLQIWWFLPHWGETLFECCTFCMSNFLPPPSHADHSHVVTVTHEAAVGRGENRDAFPFYNSAKPKLAAEKGNLYSTKKRKHKVLERAQCTLWKSIFFAPRWMCDVWARGEKCVKSNWEGMEKKKMLCVLTVFFWQIISWKIRNRHLEISQAPCLQKGNSFSGLMFSTTFLHILSRGKIFLISMLFHYLMNFSSRRSDELDRQCFRCLCRPCIE